MKDSVEIGGSQDEGVGYVAPETSGIEASKEVETVESRFGDKEALVDVMREGRSKIMGRLEDYYNIPPHRHVTEMAYVRHERIGAKDISQLVEIEDDDGGRIECVFKPLWGENKVFNDKNGLAESYPREAAAYIISEHFGLDLVPPTIVKKIDGKVGSLQIFMPQDKYKIGEEVLRKTDEEDYEKVTHSNDTMKLCVFDWIIANGDRHEANFLLKKNESGAVAVDDDEQTETIAIDNGSSMNSPFYSVMKNHDLPGPYRPLIRNMKTQENINTDIPEWLMEKIKEGADNWDVLAERIAAIPGDISTEEINSIKTRIDGLISTGVLLSSYNNIEKGIFF